MNVIMRAVAGKRCFGEDEDDATEIGRKFRWAVEEYFRLINAVSVADLLPFLKWVGAGLWDRAERRRVRRELGDLVAELLDEVDSCKCQNFLCSIVKESFRLCPVDPLLVPRESRNECTIGGFHVPSGTMLIPNVYAVYQDPEHWTDPTSFKPERFLDAEEKMKDLETVYFPFGIGRRNCPGSGLAMRVILMALGGLLQCFEWERVGEELVDMTEGRAFDVPMLKPLVAKYKARHAMLPLLS
ncbi:uncharacterized protein A4U43_C08F6300 [Asparagus officinalis]|nr:uncharacterized protein A4U43_C08F6300 [Asparagus officinalis]